MPRVSRRTFVNIEKGGGVSLTNLEDCRCLSLTRWISLKYRDNQKLSKSQKIRIRGSNYGSISTFLYLYIINHRRMGAKVFGEAFLVLPELSLFARKKTHCKILFKQDFKQSLIFDAFFHNFRRISENICDYSKKMIIHIKRKRKLK